MIPAPLAYHPLAHARLCRCAFGSESVGPFLLSNPLDWDLSPWALPVWLLSLLPLAWPFIVCFGILGPGSSDTAGEFFAADWRERAC